MNYDHEVLAYSPVIYAKMEDENAGAGIADIGSRGVAGTYSGGVTFKTLGPLVRETSYGATFDGSTGEGEMTGIVGGDLPTLPITLEAWCRPSVVPVSTSQTCLNLFATDSSEYAIIGVSVTGQWLYSHGNNSGGNATNTGALANGNMQHLVMAIDSQDSRRFYVDGVLQFTDSTSIQWDGDGGTQSTCVLAIGHNGGSSHFAGGISQVAYYKSALTSAQVESNYRAGILNPVIQGMGNKIKADADVWALAVGRVFANQLPDRPIMPAVRFAVLDDVPHQRLGSGDHFDSSIQVDAYTDRADQPVAWSLNSKIRTALNRQHIQVFGHRPAACVCTSRGVAVNEPSFSRVRSTYRIMANA